MPAVRPRSWGSTSRPNPAFVRGGSPSSSAAGSRGRRGARSGSSRAGSPSSTSRSHARWWTSTPRLNSARWPRRSGSRRCSKPSPPNASGAAGSRAPSRERSPAQASAPAGSSTAARARRTGASTTLRLSAPRSSRPTRAARPSSASPCPWPSAARAPSSSPCVWAPPSPWAWLPPRLASGPRASWARTAPSAASGTGGERTWASRAGAHRTCVPSSPPCGARLDRLPYPAARTPACAREKLEGDAPPEACGVGGERGVGPDGEHRAGEERAHGTPRNLDRDRGRQGIGSRGERDERREADQEGPRAREPHPPLETRDRQRVAPRDIIVVERGREEAPVEWAHARGDPGLEEVLRDEAQPRQLGRGQVAAAVSEIARDVAEHVGHLERLAEAHALLAHVAEVPVPEPWAVGDVQRRPEGADTAGDEIRVTVELVERVERGQARGVLAGEAREIEDHASRERGDDGPNFCAIRGRERFEARERLVDVLEEPPFGGVGLAWRARARHCGDVVGGAARRAPERLDMPHALLPHDQARVGDGGGRAREQVREANRLAKRAGGDREREIEAPADLPQEVAQQVVGHLLVVERTLRRVGRGLRLLQALLGLAVEELALLPFRLDALTEALLDLSGARAQLVERRPEIFDRARRRRRLVRDHGPELGVQRELGFAARALDPEGLPRHALTVAAPRGTVKRGRTGVLTGPETAVKLAPLQTHSTPKE